MEKEITIKFGDFQVIALDRENPMNSSAPIHMAFVQYHGMMPAVNSSVLVFKIGAYDGRKEYQKGNLYYFPANEKKMECRIDTYGRRVKLEITQASPLEIKAKDLTERQTAVRDSW